MTAHTPTELAAMTPQQIDAELARLDGKLFDKNLLADRERATLDRHAVAADRGTLSAYDRDSRERATNALAAAEDAIKELHEQMRPLDAEYARRPWSRFFLVPGGHIHASTSCSTCNRDGKLTRFAWLPELSGKTEADAVTDQGAYLCTVCFPSAPTEWTNGRELDAAAKKAAKCPGSGTMLDRDKPHRTGYYAGNWGTCPNCDARPAITSTGKLRAHKPTTH